MLPPDVANSLRTILPDVQQQTNARLQAPPVQSAQRIADVLGDLAPGQRIMAEIQALLPNGNYRAVAAQREFTLALPFSAKAGDTLELEVQETDGKLSFAVVANRSDAASGKTADPSVPTTLSRTGQIIRDLLGEINPDAGRKAPPAMLNGNQPIIADTLATPQEIAANLKQAISQSGVFYESHQARWAAGQLPTDALRAEPQGRIPVPAMPLPGTVPTPAEASAAGPSPTSAGDWLALAVDREGPAGREVAEAVGRLPEKVAGTAQEAGSPASTAGRSASEASTSTASPATAARPDSNPSGTPTGVPREIVPIVQQQLDGLASQQFVWQGQAWPGQAMQWEIDQDRQSGRLADDPEQRYWQTRLRLALPTLGGVDAVLRLGARGELAIEIASDTDAGANRLQAGAPDLRAQVEAAGLNLTQLQIRHD